MAKQSYKEDGKRPRPEYVLTPMADDLRPILIGLMQWGDAWIGGGDSAFSFTDRQTRTPVRVSFVDITGRGVDPNQLRIAIKR